MGEGPTISVFCGCLSVLRNDIVTRSWDEVKFASFLRTSRRLPITRQEALKAQPGAYALLCDVSPRAKSGGENWSGLGRGQAWGCDENSPVWLLEGVMTRIIIRMARKREIHKRLLLRMRSRVRAAQRCPWSWGGARTLRLQVDVTVRRDRPLTSLVKTSSHNQSNFWNS